MKPMPPDRRGFTLIEIIVTLTVAAILSVMLVQFMGTSLSRSAAPILSIQEGMALQGILENMNADYKRLLLTDNAPLETFKTKLDSGSYGAFPAVDYILFDNNHVEAPCDTNHAVCNLLKVTISIGDHSLTSLFTR